MVAEPDHRLGGRVVPAQPVQLGEGLGLGDRGRQVHSAGVTTNVVGHGGAQQVVETVVAELGQHLGLLVDRRADVAVEEFPGIAFARSRRRNGGNTIWHGRLQG